MVPLRLICKFNKKVIIFTYDMLNKHSYIPSQDKRFAISSDSHSRERLTVVRDLLAEIRRRFPSVRFSLALFGSLSKGKLLDEESAQNSDVDMVLYVDMDDIEREADAFCRDPEFQRLFDVKYANALTEPHVVRIRALLERRGEKSLSDYERKTVDPQRIKRYVAWLTMQNIVRKFFQSGLQERVSSLGNPELTSHFNVWPIRIGDADKHHTIWCAVNEYETHCHYGTEPDVPVEVLAPFALGVGGGLNEYIRDFVARLQNMPSGQGERIWASVNEIVRKYERRGDVPAAMERQFPSTLEQAAVRYGVSSQVKRIHP